MKWVVDGSQLCYPLTGIGQYLRGLLGALSTARPDWTFLVLTPYEPLHRIMAPNVIFDLQLSRAKAVRQSGWRAWWFDVVLPRAVADAHADAFWAADGVAPLALRHTPVVLTVYDFVPERFPKTMTWWPRRYRKANAARWIRRARWRLPISIATADEMVALHRVAAEGIVYPGVDDAFFLDDDPVTSQGAGRKYLLVVGTLEPRKNLTAMADCVQQLANEGEWPRDLELRFVGGKGWQDSELTERVRSLELSGIAQRLGYVPRDEMPSLMRGAKALLMPSMYEGFGMPIAEALAAGCPVVCSDIAPFREIHVGPSMLFHGLDRESMIATYRRVVADGCQLVRPVGRDVAGHLTWARSAGAFVDAIERGGSGDTSRAHL